MTLLRTIQGERPGMGSELGTANVREYQPRLYNPIVISKTVQLCDISFWQGAIDFTKMKQSAQGVVIRAGQRNWIDSKFATNYPAAKAAGIPRGTYWFYDSREAPERQASLWWSQIQNDRGELIHCADLEESYGGSYGTAAHMRQFVAEFQRLSGLPDSRIAVYTGYYWWNSRVGADPFFSRYDLWLAWYSSDMSIVRIPQPWSAADLLFWQYTSSGDGPTYGVSSQEVDLNWFSGDIDAYRQRFGLSAAPPTGETMDQWYEVIIAAGTHLNIRSGPGTSYSDIGDLFRGDRVEVVEKLGDWGRVVKIVRAGGAVEVPAAPSWCNCSPAYCAPVTAPPVTPTLTHTILVYSDGSVKVDGNPVP